MRNGNGAPYAAHCELQAHQTTQEALSSRLKNGLSVGVDLDRKVWRDTAGRNAKLDGMKITYKSDELSNSGAILVFDVSPGFHTLEVRARDAAGNLDPRVAAHEWVTY